MSYKFRIASPCSADWAHMKGDDRVRYCQQCNVSVYNFPALSPAEIEDLVAQHEGRLCACLYQRTDGTTLTRNCPVGFRAALVRASGFATATLSTLLSIVPVARPQTPAKQETSVHAHPRPASIVVEIIDATGAIIPGAKVTFKQEATGIEFEFKTNDIGRVTGRNLPSGFYEITIMSPGFKPRTLAHLSIPNPVLQRIQLDVAPTMGVVVIVGEVVPARQNPIKRFLARIRRIV